MLDLLDENDVSGTVSTLHIINRVPNAVVSALI